ncbi:D-alanyl-D-alanine carboxypeptidase family protein [Alicyclobacillus fodiniaquatilis]|jgi:D-alanyl-D-alanine carboxypeptidase (penicillin-binding protein 5/6)|uniref:serine-type D-Ala-D-Ala carboxypeptidase n=1 Tax=Alicyclobacillus fodiniaquatilis TaxID=1661150 RepID=A0ABW4JH60_9BACL
MPNWKRSVATTAIACSCVLGTTNASFLTSSFAATSVVPYVDDSALVSSTKTAQPEVNVSLAKEAKSAVIMDATTGKILYQKNAHKELPMASITKIMTMLLIMDAIHAGRVQWTDQVKTSEYAASMGGSQIFLEPNESMSVRDMVKGIAIASGNDACVAMAEHLSGSEEAFVAQMNQKAKQLGMNDTHFVNCNGLPAKNHYASAHDIAVMSQALLQYPEITKFTSVYSDYLRKGSAHPLWLVNSNKLVRFYDGVDGLKTGYTQEARYCLSATAKKQGFRVIAVVMGEPKPPVRNAEVSGMLNWAFSNYTSKLIYPQGHVVAKAKVSKGRVDKVEAVTAAPVGFVTQRAAKVSYETQIELMKMKAPVRQGDKVGELKVMVNHHMVAKVPLIAKTSVQKANFIQGFGKTVKKIITFGTAD